jgi:hypothetical protein
MTAKKAAAPKLTDAEVQAVADAAIRSWESGIGDSMSAGGSLWLFLPIRDDRSRVQVTREGQNGDIARTEATAAELGTAEARTLMASRVLALASQ